MRSPLRPIPNLIFDTLMIALGVAGVARGMVWAFTTINPGAF